MSEEIKNETEVKPTCICQSKGFRKFLTIALGSFVGVFCALSLFAALHKPPMPYGPYGVAPIMCPCHCKMHHFNKFDRGPQGDFYKRIEKKKEFEHRLEKMNQEKVKNDD